MKRNVIFAGILVVLVGVTIWMTAIGQVGIFRMAPPSRVLSETLQHLKIVAAAEGLAILFGVPIGFAISRRALRYVSPILVGTANVGQTVPTLAFLGIAGAALGMGYEAAVIALFVYALLPIIRNTYAGIASVDPRVKEAARGMGMSKWQVLYKVELMLSVPVILAGIRTSTVVNVGTAAIAAMIGAGGLGDLIVTGIAVRVTQMILQGAAPTAALAIILDWLLSTLERGITPRGMRT